MTPRQWERAEELFARGLELPAPLRATILEECADDPEIRDELQRLWRHADSAGSFLETPALPHAFAQGAIVAERFRVLQFIGAGGMGEVYQARDLRLGRMVALKVLPARLAGNAVLRQRLEQEARAVSTLNHPRICAIHDLATDGPFVFMVMEFVAGETLERRLERGPLTEHEATRIALQVCEALQHAHERGLVHRDLKPANIMLGATGVKLLDFGIATWSGPDTDESLMAGSPAYMSPEQASGGGVDARSDIFSLGLVLWEMLTGQRALPRGTGNSAEIPALRTLARTASAHSESIVARCLAPLPDDRFPTVAALSNALSRGKRITLHRIWALPLLALLVTVSAAGLWAIYRQRLFDQPVLRPLTAMAGVEFYPVLSPDGKRVSFLATGPGDDGVGLYVQSVEAGEPRRLTSDPEPHHSPAWSPDGRWIAFTRGGYAWIVSPEGGPDRRLIAVAPESGQTCDIQVSWSPDSREVLFTAPEPAGMAPSLHAISVQSGVVRRIHSAPSQSAGDWCPLAAPGGRRILWKRRSPDTKPPQLMLADLDPNLRVHNERALPHIQAVTWTWANDAEVLFSRTLPAGSFLFRAKVDQQSTPQQLPFGEEGLYPSVAPAARRLAYMRRAWDVDLFRVPLNGSAGPQPFLSSTRRELLGEYSPRGTHVAFLSQRGGSISLWVANQDGTEPRDLAPLDQEVAPPRWSPDGRSLVYGDHGDIWTVGLDGKPPRRLIMDPANDSSPNFSPDGRWLYFTSDRSGRAEVWRAPVDGGAAIQMTRQGGFAPLVSTDGQFLFFLRAEGPRDVLYVQPVNGGPAERIAETIRRRVNLAVRAEGLYFISGGAWDARAKICLYDPKRRVVREVLTLPRKQRWTASGLSLTPDGRTALFAGGDMKGDLMLVENFE